MVNKDFFLYNIKKYAVDDKKSNIKMADLNGIVDDIDIIEQCRSPEMRTKICVGKIINDKCFLSVCSTEFNSDKQHLYIEIRDIKDLNDLIKIYHIIKETYRANINEHTKEKHSC